jgi:hypothetical protein
VNHKVLHRLWRGGRFLAFLLPLCFLGSAAWPRPAVPPTVPEILLYVNDTVVSPGDGSYYLSVYLTNVLQEVAGVEITLSAGVSGLIRLRDSIRIETTIVCIDPSDCNPADTTVDTLHIAPILLAGSELANWDFVQARALSPYTFRLAAVADFPGGSSPLPLATGGPHLLFNIPMVREATPEVLDTLHDRRVPWQIASTATSFSDATGKSIGLQESLLCLNPPVCDLWDTVSYYDPAINIYIDGAVTFGPNCLRGDANGSGTVSATDIIVIINYVFKSGPQPGCHGQSADVDCNGAVGASDIVYLVNYVYKSGPAPCGG